VVAPAPAESQDAEVISSLDTSLLRPQGV